MAIKIPQLNIAKAAGGAVGSLVAQLKKPAKVPQISINPYEIQRKAAQFIPQPVRAAAPIVARSVAPVAMAGREMVQSAQRYSNLNATYGNKLSTPTKIALAAPAAPDMRRLLQPIPQAQFSQNISNPALRFAASIPESIINIPKNALMSSVNIGENLARGETRPQPYLADAARAAELPVTVATFGGVGAAKAAGKQGLKELAKTSAFQGAKFGGIYGGLAGLQAGSNASNVQTQLLEGLKGVALGGVAGATLGGALSAGGYIAIKSGGKLIKLTLDRLNDPKVQKALAGGRGVIQLGPELKKKYSAEGNLMSVQNPRLVKSSDLQYKGNPDAKLYEQAFNKGDLATMEKLAARHPGDTTFTIHKTMQGLSKDLGKQIVDIVKNQGGFVKLGEKTARVTGSKAQGAAKVPQEKLTGQQATLPTKVSSVSNLNKSGELSLNKTLANISESVKGGFGKQRKFLESVAGSDQTTNPLKVGAKGVTPQTYLPESNKQAVARASEFVNKSPDLARKEVFSSKPVSGDKSALGISLAKKYESQKNYDAAVEVIEHLDKEYREAGRFVQAASLWSKLSPEGMLRFANKEVQKAAENQGVLSKGLNKALGKGKIELNQQDKTFILKEMGRISKMPEGTKKNEATRAVLQKISDKIPPSVSEYFDAYRYQNMLASPKTQERNIYSNLMNTYVNRPYELGTRATVDWMGATLFGKKREVYFKDVPQYYKDVFNAFPSAIEAAKLAWKGKTPISKPDLEAIRRTNLPKGLTIVPRAMESQDKLFSTLISAGEYGRLKKAGVADNIAREQAHKLAEKYLYRGATEAGNKDNAILIRALDGLSNIISEARKVPVAGRAFSWFVPFVQTPINFAKANVERSPYGLIGGNMSREQLSKAVSGSILMGVGAKLALDNKTTWEVPKDEAAKELFYAEGKKPYSIRVGDAWVPMWTAGPYALSLAIPAAIKHSFGDSETAPSDDQIQKITGALLGQSKFLVSQTPLQGVSGFLRLVEGESDFKLPNLLGFTASQLVPMEGLVRYVNANFIDPVYRKSSSFGEAIKRDLPGLSKTLDPYRQPTGEESRREGINAILPYDIGIQNPTYSGFSQQRTEQLQQKNFQRKEAQNAYNNFKSLNGPQKAQEALRLKAEKPEVFKQVIELAKQEQKGSTSLGATVRGDFKSNNPREKAQVIYKQLYQIPDPQQRAAVYLKLKKEGVINPGVARELLELRKR